MRSLLVSLFPTRYIKALTSFGVVSKPLVFSETTSIDSIQDTDAHYSVYRLKDADGKYTEHPRLAKASLAGMQARDSILEFNFLLADIDAPKHTRLVDLNDDGKFFSTVVEVFDSMKTKPTIYHTTQAGFRALWVLVKPIIDPIEWEDRQRGLCNLLVASGMPVAYVDDSAAQWHRLFRAPNVIREGNKLHEKENNPFYIYIQNENLSSIETFNRVNAPPKANITAKHEDMPDPIESRLLVDKIMDSGRFKLTSFGKQASSKLKNSEIGRAHV